MAKTSETASERSDRSLERYTACGSITPTSFIGIEDVSDVENVYCATYQCGKQVALHFGIRNDARGIVAVHAADSTASISVDDGTNAGAGDGAGAGAKSVKTAQSSKSKSTKVQKAIAEKVQPEEVEIDALQQAINHLLSGDSVAVLVDILAREAGVIKAPIEGAYEVHTVVLYCNPADEDTHIVTVIDPSNFLFSLHLSNDVVTTRITHGTLEKIVVIPWAKGQIYKSNKETGPAPDQFRDCVDIAVKLAFGFNAQEEPLKILTKKDVIQNPVIQCISNNNGIDRHWEYQVAGRMKQASEWGVVDMFHNCSQKMTTLLAALEEIESEGMEEISSVELRAEYNAHMQKFYPPTQYLEQLDVLSEFAGVVGTVLKGGIDIHCLELIAQREVLGKIEGESYE